MHRTITTLHEYRTLYPDSAAIPTLTQRGLLGLLLDRQRYKAANLARRQARWKSICATPRKICVWIWRALTVLQLPRDRIGTASPGSQILPSPDLFRPTSNRADIGSRRQP
jgi:hypothetical protein